MVAIIGVTGGIAVGKTALSDYWSKKYKIDVIDADNISCELLKKDKLVREKVHFIFGDSVFAEDGSVIRSKIRDIIFYEDEKRFALEKLLHPIIRKKMDSLLLKANSSYVLAVVPLLVETKTMDRYDRVLVVDSVMDARFNRCKQRGLSIEIAKAIMEKQASRQERFCVCDDIVYNTRSFNFLYSQIDKLACYYKHIFK